MYNNYDYPCGADGPNAPWNKTENAEKNFFVEITQTLTKKAIVSTNDYNIIEDYDEEDDGEGNCITVTCNSIDTSDTDWKEAYLKEHLTLDVLLKECKELLSDIKETGHIISFKEHNKIYSLIEELEDWENVELEIQPL